MGPRKVNPHFLIGLITNPTTMTRAVRLIKKIMTQPVSLAKTTSSLTGKRLWDSGTTTEDLVLTMSCHTLSNIPPTVSR